MGTLITWIKCFDKRKHDYVFWLWSAVMHSILLWGVLDINFHSPIIPGLQVVPPLKDAPAKRLLLFVADGLRFRTFIEDPPAYLKYIMNNEGSWGIAHTRVPTESRPGIVAIVSGFYEDPSAIFKGWKENPVDFDFVFNQSRSTWAWGSPDIIPMFTKGKKGTVYGRSYPSDWQNFDSLPGRTIRLDAWVFDKYLEWLKTDARMVKDLDGIILFLHLLGCDTAGHSSKPMSTEYKENMNYVNRRIKEIVQITESTFGAGSTAYIFTADHGMTDWGSHGSGSKDETETPLIAWGAGVAKLNSQQDVDQRNIAPLISALIGIPTPINNEGELPLQYLKSDNQIYRCRALYNNVQQLLHQVKAHQTMSCSGNDTAWQEIEINVAVSNIDRHSQNKNADACIREGVKAIKLIKHSLSYYQQYQRIQFLTYLSLMWIGWIMLLFLRISGVHRQNPKKILYTLINIGFGFWLIILFIKQKGCNDWRLSFYALAALSSLWFGSRSLIILSPKLLVEHTKQSYLEIFGTIFLLITMLLGLTHRFVLSIGMLATAILQKLLIKSDNRLLFWTGLVLSVFPLLPVVEPYPRTYIVLTSICFTVCVVHVTVKSKWLKILEIIRLIVTGIVYSGIIDGRSGMAWLILISVPLYVSCYSQSLNERINAIVFGLFCPLALLSASYEPIFFLMLTLHLRCWPQCILDALKRPETNFLRTDDLCKAAYFMLYTLLCFFGTGNMASISSFDPSWTRHFITVFSPFLMFSLILFKISIPLILLGCTSQTVASPKMFLAVLLLGDCLTLPLACLVTPQGSWLDIGSAISRFIIAIVLPCLLMLLYYVSRPLLWLNVKKFQHYMNYEKRHIV